MEHREPPSHLLCSIGTGNYTPVDYVLNDRTISTAYAPVAVARLCGMAPGRATILATEEAERKHFTALRGELDAAGFAVELVRMNFGITRQDFMATLVQFIALVDAGERVVLDVTFGFRHLPFTYLAALTYLSSFRGISVGGIYYGALDQRTTDAEGRTTAPIFDLTPMFELTQWYHAVQSANDSGDLRPLERAIERDIRAEKRRTRMRAPLERLEKGLHALAPALAAGLPIETGLAARRILDALQEVDLDSLPPELAPLSLKPLAERLASWAIPEGVDEKAEVRLDRSELERQLLLIRWYIERENIQQALLLLREWLVSRAVFATGAADWLGYGNRKRHEAAINAAADRARQNADAGGIGMLWKQVADARNYLAHADTQLDAKLPASRQVRDWVDRCEALLASPLDLAPPGRDLLLLTPLGLTPGVVFTAAHHVRPDQAIIITSKEAEASAAEALAAAGMANLPREVRTLADPFAGIAEARELADSLRPKLAEARELVVNLTGGTTAMQLVVERLAQSAARLGIPVRRIFLVDRRPADEQRREPYVLGDVVPLDGPDDEDEADE